MSLALLAPAGPAVTSSAAIRWRQAGVLACCHVLVQHQRPHLITPALPDNAQDTKESDKAHGKDQKQKQAASNGPPGVCAAAQPATLRVVCSYNSAR